MNNQNNSATVQAQMQMPPEVFLTNIAFGALMTQALYVAAKLSVADLLANGEKSITELAAATEMNERGLYRVLRSLASNGIFRETETGNFVNTEYSDLLRSDAATSMRNGVIFMGEDWHWHVWGNLLESVKTGKSAWGFTHGSKEVFDYFAENPRQSEIFNKAMTDMSSAVAPVVVDAYDFSGFQTFADIAGGHGYLLAQILKSAPQTKGILFDLPHVVAGASEMLEREGVAERVQKIGGDFFAEVPTADGYIMKHIIHDWDDERSLRILQSINRAIKDGGKLLIVETVVPEGNEPHYSKLLDLEMLVSPGGVERTASEYRELLSNAGFRLTRIIPTKSPFSIVEAEKV